MCIHVYAFVCICMLAAVLMVTVMQTKPKEPHTPPALEAESNSNDESKEDNQVSIPVCGGMHLDA